MPNKLLLLLFFLCTISISYAQTGTCPPPNIGFEDGTFKNWECAIGNVGPDGVVSVFNSIPVTDRQTMIDKNYPLKLDPYGEFPTLCPGGGTHSIKLGNDGTNHEAEQVSYTFTVPTGSDQYNITFYYAVVLQNPSHQPFEQPRFTVKTYDVTDNNTYIDCASFDFIAASNLPGFKVATGPAASGKEVVYYKDWSAANINLHGYAGKQIRLEFTTNDCTHVAHFGYAYLDVSENCASPITGNAYCTGQNSVTLQTLDGFGSYDWYTGDLKTKVGTGRSLTIEPAPPDNSSYAVVVSPLNGLGCVNTFYTTVKKIDNGFNLKVVDTIYTCNDSPADLTAGYVTAGSSSGLTFSYFKDNKASIFAAEPDALTESGTYYIKGVNAEGCNNILPVTVILVDKGLVKVTNPAPVVYPAGVDLAKTFPHINNFVYTYYKDADCTQSVGNTVQVSGTYYIKATYTGGCFTIVPVTVIVNPPPPVSIQSFNTFTPNNDGVNDYFVMSITGYIQSGQLTVYNRNGQLVYSSRLFDIQWDGTFNGKGLPAGVYYWVYNGTDSYTHKPVKQSGSVALIR